MLPLALAGSALSAGGSILGANSQASELRSQADQLDARAGSTRATSQRQAIEERRQGDLVSSRALALAAAGGGADDPSVINDLANISGRGEYSALSDLYNGETSAQSDEAQAAANRRGASAVKTAGVLKAAGTMIGTAPTILNHGSSLFTKYR